MSIQNRNNLNFILCSTYSWPPQSFPGGDTHSSGRRIRICKQRWSNPSTRQSVCVMKMYLLNILKRSTKSCIHYNFLRLMDTKWPACLLNKWYQVFVDLWHSLYIRRSPGPSPRCLPGLYPYLPRDLQVLERKTSQHHAISIQILWTSSFDWLTFLTNHSISFLEVWSGICLGKNGFVWEHVGTFVAFWFVWKHLEIVGNALENVGHKMEHVWICLNNIEDVWNMFGTV